MKQYKIAIVGSGIIGMTCALYLAKLSNIQITLYGKFPKHSEYKTTAILKTSFNLLKQIIDINEDDKTIHKVKKFKIIDQISNRKKRLDFDSSELDIDTFAYNIKDSLLSDKLINQIKKSKNIIHINEVIRSINTNLQEAIIDYEGNAVGVIYAQVKTVGGKRVIGQQLAVGMKEVNDYWKSCNGPGGSCN